MSNSRTPASDSPNPTRQMLDDLDALMERMLSLPVADAAEMSAEPLPPAGPLTMVIEKEPAAPVAAGPAPALDEMVISHPAALIPSPSLPLQGPHLRPVPAGKVIVGRLSAPPSFTIPEKDQENPQGPAVADEQLLGTLWSAEAPASDDPLPPLIAKTVAPVEMRPARSYRSIRRLPLLLLLTVNQGFDRCTTWLGGPGKWLRSSGGRYVLGFLGLGLLALAAVWCLHDWLGWTWPGDSLE